MQNTLIKYWERKKKSANDILFTQHLYDFIKKKKSLYISDKENI